MRNRVKKSIVLTVVITMMFSLFCLSVAALEPDPLIVNYEAGTLNVSGRVNSNELVVAVLIYDGNTLLRMVATDIDGERAFEVDISIALEPGNYMVKVAEYEGGEFFATSAFTVEAPVTPPSPGGGEAGSDDPTEYLAQTSEGNSLAVDVDTTSGHASVDLGDVAGAIEDGDNPSVTIPAIPGVTSYSGELPVDALKGDKGNSLSLNTGIGSVTLPSNMLAGTGHVECIALLQKEIS